MCVELLGEADLIRGIVLSAAWFHSILGLLVWPTVKDRDKYDGYAIPEN